MDTDGVDKKSWDVRVLFTIVNPIEVQCIRPLLNSTFSDAKKLKGSTDSLYRSTKLNSFLPNILLSGNYSILPRPFHRTRLLTEINKKKNAFFLNSFYYTTSPYTIYSLHIE